MTQSTQSHVIDDAQTWIKFSPDLQTNKWPIKRPKKVLFVDPENFCIESSINVHMLDESGQLNTVNKEKARRQWQELVDAYRPLVEQVLILKPPERLPDIVFCANQTLPFTTKDGNRRVLLSEMRSPTRKPEVKHLAEFFRSIGYSTVQQESNNPYCFEGMGDFLPIPGGQVICAGHGPRTDRAALEWVALQTSRPVVSFELPNPKFYHLDTCLSILDEHTALACREGFTITGWNLLLRVFPVVLEADPEESNAPGFACNSHSPDGKHVIIQRGNPKTMALLESASFKTIEVDTDEFIKAGGSVFCMKMMFE